MMANPFEVNVLGGYDLGRGLSQLGQTFANRQAYDEQQSQEAQMQELQQRAFGGDAEAIQQLAAINPQLASEMQQRVAGQEQAQFNDMQKRTAEYIARANALPLEQREAYFEQAINNPNLDIDEEDRVYFTNPDQARAVVGKVLGKDYAKDIYGDQAPDKFSQGTGEMSGYSFNENTGDFSINPALKSKLDEAKNNPDIDAKTRSSINKDLTQLTQDTKLIRNTAQDLDKLSKMKGGPASIAMVFKFMKALDPTSVVREGEFMTAENSSGVPEKMRNYYNKVMSGEILGQAQMSDFVMTAKGLANSAIDSSSSEVTSYLDTFEDTLPKSFKNKLLGRIPERFDIKTEPEKPKDTVGAPQGALDALTADPSLITQFKAKYGYVPEGY